MSESKDDVAGANEPTSETVANRIAQTAPPWPLYGACINAAISAGGLASLTLYAGILPKPWFVYLAALYVPVSAGFAMYSGLRYLRER